MPVAASCETSNEDIISAQRMSECGSFYMRTCQGDTQASLDTSCGEEVIVRINEGGKWIDHRGIEKNALILYVF